MHEYTAVTGAEVKSDPTLADWRFIHGVLQAHFETSSFTAASQLATVIASAADMIGHHPDLDIRYPGGLWVAVTTHVAAGVTDRDVSLARTISQIASQAGALAKPSSVQSVEVAIDTADADRIRPFWQAVLGYLAVGDNLVDPRRSGPTIWFQESDETRTESGRLHLDVDVPHDLVEERIAAALEAGGTLVSDKFAPSWWVLADVDGNEACLCTWQPNTAS